MVATSDLTPLPSAPGAWFDRLTSARAEAVDALQQAEARERKARKARRSADQRVLAYEDLIRDYQTGQDPLPGGEEWGK